jgi:hypothetical protein
VIKYKDIGSEVLEFIEIYSDIIDKYKDLGPFNCYDYLQAYVQNIGTMSERNCYTIFKLCDWSGIFFNNEDWKYVINENIVLIWRALESIITNNIYCNPIIYDFAQKIVESDLYWSRSFIQIALDIISSDVVFNPSLKPLLKLFYTMCQKNYAMTFFIDLSEKFMKIINPEFMDSYAGFVENQIDIKDVVIIPTRIDMKHLYELMTVTDCGDKIGRLIMKCILYSDYFGFDFYSDSAVKRQALELIIEIVDEDMEEFMEQDKHTENDGKLMLLAMSVAEKSQCLGGCSELFNKYRLEI